MTASEENNSQSSNLKTLLEMAIQELIQAQNLIREQQKVLHEEIQPRILNALSSLDDVLAIQAIELDENLHREFISSYEKSNIFQEEIYREPEIMPTFRNKGKAVQATPFSIREVPKISKKEEEEFIVVQPRQTAVVSKDEQSLLTMAQFSAYTKQVYTTHSTNSLLVEGTGKYPRLHFLAGSNADDVFKAFTYGYCGSITSSPGNREILLLPRILIEAVKKFRRSSRSDMVVLKLISASPEIYPSPQPGWVLIQLCTPNKANIAVKANNHVRYPELNDLWVSHRRAEGFAVLLRKLTQIREKNQGFMYNSPTNMFINAEGNCVPRFDAINKISAGISRINACRVPGSFPMLTHLCGIIHTTKNAGCSICPRRT